MTGRVCDRHGTPQWCPDGVCPYCSPEPAPAATPRAARVPFLDWIESAWRRRQFRGYPAIPSPAPEIVCPHFGLAYPSPVWYGPDADAAVAKPAPKLVVVRDPEDCAECAIGRVKALGDELKQLIGAAASLLHGDATPAARAMVTQALHSASEALRADARKWRGPR